MINMVRERLPIFWGCTFTHNLPFLMESTRLMLEKMGIKAMDVKDAGCCPDPVYVQAYSHEAALALSARNLALAEGQGDEVLVPCNGCYNVLNEARKELEEPNLRERINRLLPDDLKYSGGLKVTHIVDKISSELPIVNSLRERELSGLKVAVHYGCHSIYPPAAKSDSPKNPESIDRLVELAGAESLEYPGKLDCCGISVMNLDEAVAYRLLRNKLTTLKDKADCIVTNCPGCFTRFDMLPEDITDLATPVIHLSELLCLAFGIPTEKIFFEGHRIPVHGVLDKLDIESRKLGEFNLELLDSHCGACSKECTAAIVTRDTPNPFDPMEVVRKLKANKLEEVLKGEDIWRCLQCGKCETNCPINAGLKKLFLELREMAIARGGKPKMLDQRIKTLVETGFIAPARRAMRRRMGIPLAEEIETESIRSIFEELR